MYSWEERKFVFVLVSKLITFENNIGERFSIQCTPAKKILEHFLFYIFGIYNR